MVEIVPPGYVLSPIQPDDMTGKLPQVPDAYTMRRFDHAFTATHIGAERYAENIRKLIKENRIAAIAYLNQLEERARIVNALIMEFHITDDGDYGALVAR